MTTLKAWDGKEWQKYIEELLVLHYGPEDFQRIPDECQGDLGLEAFTRSGNGIQCYAPQGRLTIKQRYEKHRIKLSVDISELMQNQDGLRAVLGQTVLKRWFRSSFKKRGLARLLFLSGPPLRSLIEST